MVVLLGLVLSMVAGLAIIGIPVVLAIVIIIIIVIFIWILLVTCADVAVCKPVETLRTFRLETKNKRLDAHSVMPPRFWMVSTEILMVIESLGRRCEALIHGLESPVGCCDASYKRFLWNIGGRGSFRKLLWMHCWWFGISRRLLWSYLRTFAKKYKWFWKLQAAAVNPLLLVWNL